MALNILKLCVGCDSIEDLVEWRDQDAAWKRANRLPVEQYHVTRMFPQRKAEVLDGGSLYWVMRGEILCREKIVALESFKGSDGRSRCRIVMEPNVVAVEPRPMRAFQGWRYLKAEAAPRIARSWLAVTPGGDQRRCSLSFSGKLLNHRT